MTNPEYDGVPEDVAAECEALWEQWMPWHRWYTGKHAYISRDHRAVLIRIHELLSPYGQFAASCKAHGEDPRRIRNWVAYQNKTAAGKAARAERVDRYMRSRLAGVTE